MDGSEYLVFFKWKETNWASCVGFTEIFFSRSEAAMEKSRGQVADLIGADPKEIVFTSGATESNNISVKGLVKIFNY